MNLNDEECDQIQNNELEVLKSIFLDDYSEVGASKNGKHFRLKISSNQSIRQESTSDSSSSISVELDIILGRKYPLKIPSISIYKQTKLNEETISILNSQIISLAQSKVGNEMIYDITQHISQYLCNFSNNCGSVYDDMKKRQQIELEKKKKEEEIQKQTCFLEEEQRKEELIQEIDKEKQKMLEMIEKEKTRKAKEKTQFQNTFEQKVPSPLNQNDLDFVIEFKPDHNLEIDEEESERNNKTSNTVNSRYLTDFEEIERIGKGGFGEVFKVRHRIDTLIYAIKKVKLEPKKSLLNRKILNEVTTISQLYHHYIVRYYQAWVEMEVLDNNKFGNLTMDFSRDSPNNLIGMELDSDSQLLEDWDEHSKFTFTTTQDDSFLDDHILMNDKISDNNVQYLFIQMEYCANKTLRTVIDDSIDSIDVVWKLFRQILEAVAHIHSKNIIHRDLKPANVFIDSKGDVKIGDFGLAAVTGGKILNPDVVREDSYYAQDPDQSINERVGTSLYMSPEQEQGLTYHQNADIFALGIIFFEMWTKFSTESERISVLTELRTTNKVPQNFTSWLVIKEVRSNESLLKNIKTLIELMLDCDPEQRPNANDLLRLGIIPTGVDAKYVEMTLDAIKKPGTAFHTSIMNTLFSTYPTASTDFTFDFGIKPSIKKYDKLGLSHRMHVFKSISRIMEIHCAVEINTPLLMPAVHSEDTPNICMIVDPGGTLLQLPPSLTTPFARMVAHKEIQYSRRFLISKIYRRNGVSRQPHEIFECVFDIIWPEDTNLSGDNTLYLTAFISESLVIFSQIIDIFPFLGNHTVLFNHLAILDSIIDTALKIDTEKKFSPFDNDLRHKQIISLLSVGGYNNQNTKEQLFQILGDKAFRFFENLIRLRGSSEKIFPILLNTFSGNKTVLNAISELKSIFSFLQETIKLTNLDFLIQLDLLFDYQKYKNHILFETFGSKIDVNPILRGGQYDNLINLFKPPTRNTSFTPKHGVGINIAIEKIIALNFEAEQSCSTKESRNSFYAHQYSLRRDLREFLEAGALLYYNKGELLLERMSLAINLWKEYIPALYFCPPSSFSGKDVIQNYCKCSGLKFLIVFRPKHFLNGYVELKNLADNSFSEINISDTIYNIKHMQKTKQSSGISSSGVHVNIINVGTLKPQMKSKIASLVRSQFGALFQSLDPSSYCLVAIELPIISIRIVVQSYHKNSNNFSLMKKAAFNEIPSKQNKPAEALFNLIQRKIEQKTKFIFMYSITDQSVDMIWNSLYASPH